MPPYQPYQPQPLYQAPAPMFQPAPPPPPPQPVYQAPVTKRLTVKMMIAVFLFMVVGTLGMLGLSELAQVAHESLAYSSLQSYDSTRFHIDIPAGWSVGGRKNTAAYSQAEFYDGQAEDALSDKTAELQLDISFNAYVKLPNTVAGKAEIKSRSLATLRHRLEDYEKSLQCSPGRQVEVDETASGTVIMGHAISLTCMSDNKPLQIFALYSVNRQGDLLTEVMHTTPKVWAAHHSILIQSLKSLRVTV